MNDEQGFSPTLPITGQGNPKPTVPAGQPRTLLISLVDGELLAKGEILEHAKAVGAKSFSTNGPSRMPARISPTMRGCLSRSAFSRCPLVGVGRKPTAFSWPLCDGSLGPVEFLFSPRANFV
jgi:hypothetical protein